MKPTTLIFFIAAIFFAVSTNPSEARTTGNNSNTTQKPQRRSLGDEIPGKLQTVTSSKALIK